MEFFLIDNRKNQMQLTLRDKVGKELATAAEQIIGKTFMQEGFSNLETQWYIWNFKKLMKLFPLFNYFKKIGHINEKSNFVFSRSFQYENGKDVFLALKQMVESGEYSIVDSEGRYYTYENFMIGINHESFTGEEIIPTPDTNLNYVALCNRTRNALMRNGITTLGALMALDMNEINRLPGIGYNSSCEIKSFLERYGYKE